NPGDISYGYINFVTGTGSSNIATPNSTAVPVTFGVDYVARANNDVGSVATDWVAGGGLKGSAPIWGLGGPGTTTPTSFANLPINSLGAPNFSSSPPNHVATTPTDLNFVISNPGPSSIVIDPNVTITTTSADETSQSANLYFPGSATVAINSADYDPT